MSRAAVAPKRVLARPRPAGRAEARRHLELVAHALG